MAQVKQGPLRTESGESVTLTEPIGKGGEGQVFKTVGGHVAKIFGEEQNLSLVEGKVRLMIKSGLSFQGICFPKQLLENAEGEFQGYLMDPAEGVELQVSIFQPKLLAKKFPSWTRVELCQLCLKLIEIFEYLHNNGVIVGDINPQNILVTEDLKVFIVDTDSFQIGGKPCPVGTTHFTAPEIQGEKFESFLRTEKHEYFAVATLLFMMFLPGKSPYSFQGGGSVKENILSKNFSFPLGDDDNFLTPKGMWEFIWYELSYDVRLAFYRTFKEGHRFGLEYWKNTLADYLEQLNNNHYPKEIIPTDTNKIVRAKSIGMNTRDVREADRAIRRIRTELVELPKEHHVGVLELSTKAVKLLYSNDVRGLIEDGFSFQRFQRFSDKTDTGFGLDEKNVMDMHFFKRRVLPSVSKFVDMARRNGVHVLYCVATAAYRTAKNREEIVQMIKDECGINVRIISKEEESKATVTAFFHSRPSYLASKLMGSKRILMIDQGGGSTEITLFDNNAELVGNYSINLGTTVLRTILFREASDKTLLDKALEDVSKFIRERFRTVIKNSEFLADNSVDFALAVGTAITKATGKRGNKDQHGTTLSLDRIHNTILKCDEELNLKYYYVSDLYHDLKNGGRGADTLDNLIVMRLGLVMFEEIMVQFGIESITVSGTGLWYGVYFQQVLK